MPVAMIHAYINAIPDRQAELSMSRAELALLPHMKEQDRKRTLSEWARRCQARGEAPRATLTEIEQMGFKVIHA